MQLRDFGRLSEALLAIEGEVQFELDFYLDEWKRPRIGGRVKSVLPLECQRCLGRMDFPVDARLDLVVIEVHQEVENIPDTCETVLVPDEQLRLLDLVEDELLLSLPQVARHDRTLCNAASGGGSAARGQAKEDSRESVTKDSPFAVLAGLKTKQTE
ncbi:MAG: hypothetical protein GY703_19710 [Gammaproteobacteria bacterium]|nr:hypothetical protein [Gammaproteobacteria bacterium]